MSRRVVAIVLHRDVDAFLERSVRSLLEQRRRPDEIVVAHLGVGEPPTWLAERYPEADVLAPTAPCTTGAAVQAIISTIEAEAYLFQESTGWSAPDRLACLLATARDHGAGVVGSDYVVIDPQMPDARRQAMPRAGSIADQLGAGARVADPSTMLVERAMVERLGGFNTRLSMAAGDEFVARAATTGRVANAPHALYFHCEHGRSDWSTETRDGSLRDRVAVAGLRERSRHHALALARRQVPDAVLRMPPDPVELVRVSKSPSATGMGAVLVPTAAAPGAKVEVGVGTAEQGSGRATSTAPLFVVSASEALARFVACSLGQHRHLTPVDVTSWMADIATTAARFASVGRSGGMSDRAEFSASLAEVCRSASAAVDAMFVRGSTVGGSAGDEPVNQRAPRWVGALPADGTMIMAAALLYPEAAFVHVVRPVDRAVAIRLDAVGDVDVDVAYDSWLANIRVILDVFQLLDDRRVHPVQFEALLRNPCSLLSELLASVGERPDAACVNFFEHASEGAAVRPRPIPDLPGVPAQLEARRLSLALSGVSAVGERERTRLLVKTLAGAPPPVPPTAVVQAEVRDDGRNPYHASHELIRRYAPRGSIVCVVSKGDEMAVRIRNHSVGWHFPQTDEGEYVGYHPREARDAIAHLEELRERGADLFLVPRVYGWWLDHYTELRHHLERTYRRVPATEDEGTLFDLRNRPLMTLPDGVPAGGR